MCKKPGVRKKLPVDKGAGGKKTTLLKNSRIKKTACRGARKNVYCVKKPHVKKLPVGGGAGGKNALCKKIPV
jgi:hypothetical protein